MNFLKGIACLLVVFVGTTSSRNVKIPLVYLNELLAGQNLALLESDEACKDELLDVANEETKASCRVYSECLITQLNLVGRPTQEVRQIQSRYQAELNRVTTSCELDLPGIIINLTTTTPVTTTTTPTTTTPTTTTPTTTVPPTTTTKTTVTVATTTPPTSTTTTEGPGVYNCINFSVNACKSRPDGNYLVCPPYCQLGVFVTCSGGRTTRSFCVGFSYLAADQKLVVERKVFHPPTGRCEYKSPYCSRDFDKLSANDISLM